MDEVLLSDLRRRRIANEQQDDARNFLWPPRK
jgi:hypothetical protein